MPPIKKIIPEAATWVIRLEAGLDENGQDAFLQWLAADPQHGEEYERQRALWSRLDILSGLRPENESLPDRDLLRPRKER